MKFIATVNIMPREELLDPQGKATVLGLKNLGLASIGNVRIGKRMRLEVDAKTQEEAEKSVKEACDKLLANAIMEKYEFDVVKA